MNFFFFFLRIFRQKERILCTGAGRQVFTYQLFCFDDTTRHIAHTVHASLMCVHSPSALKSSPSKKGRVSLTVPKCVGPGSAWSASQLPSERDENIYDLRGARSFPTLEDEGKYAVGCLHVTRLRIKTEIKGQLLLSE